MPSSQQEDLDQQFDRLFGNLDPAEHIPQEERRKVIEHLGKETGLGRFPRWTGLDKFGNRVVGPKRFFREPEPDEPTSSGNPVLDEETIRQIWESKNRRELHGHVETRRKLHQQVLKAREEQQRLKEQDALTQPSLGQRLKGLASGVLQNIFPTPAGPGGGPAAPPVSPVPPQAAPPVPQQGVTTPEQLGPKPAWKDIAPLGRIPQAGGGTSTKKSITVDDEALGPGEWEIPLLVPGNEMAATEVQAFETDDEGRPIPGGKPAPGREPYPDEVERAIQYAKQHPEVKRRPLIPSQPGQKPFTPNLPPAPAQSEVSRSLIEPFKETGKSLLFRGPVKFFDYLDEESQKLSKASGLSYGGLFKQVADLARQRAEGNPIDPTMATRVYKDVAEWVTAEGPKMFGFTKLLGMLPGFAAYSAYETARQPGSTWKDSLLAAIKGALFGGELKALSVLGVVPRTTLGGATFAGQAAAEGERQPEKLTEEALKGGIFMAPGPVQGQPIREPAARPQAGPAPMTAPPEPPGPPGPPPAPAKPKSMIPSSITPGITSEPTPAPAGKAIPPAPTRTQKKVVARPRGSQTPPQVTVPIETTPTPLEQPKRVEPPVAKTPQPIEQGLVGPEEKEGIKALGKVMTKPGAPQPSQGLIDYATEIVNRSPVKRIVLVGSQAAKGTGRDTDLIYDFGTVGLPKESAKASTQIERLLESAPIDLDRYDTFIKADGRYFHVSSGAGREVIENTEYAAKQAGKPSVDLATARRKEVSVKDLHRLAEEKGLKWDKDKTFMALTEQVTGKKHLDELSPAERLTFYNTLNRIRFKPQVTAPTARAPAPVAEPLLSQPRSELPPDQNQTILAHAEKAQADLEIAGRERGGKVFLEQQGQGSTPEVRGLKSPTAPWYKELTTGERPLKRQQIETAIQKIIQDEGLDRGKAVERVKEALLADPEFAGTPWGQRLEAFRAGKPAEPLPWEAEAPLPKGQTEIPVPPQPIGAKPKIGREPQPGEAPLFSKAAQEPEPEQSKLPIAKDEGERGSAPVPGAETAAKVGETVKAVKTDLQTLLAPSTVTEASRRQARIMRPHLAELARQTERASETLKKAAKTFHKMPIGERYEFIDKLETGGDQPNPELTEIAGTLRTMLDGRREEVRALGTGKLEQFIEDYFPHIWKDPKKAASEFAQAYGKRPLEGSKAFLRPRTIPTTREGVELGLEPVSTNPVDLALLKLREIDRYLMGQRVFAEMKEQGHAKFVKFGKGPPEGWQKIHDKIAKVYQYSKTEKGFVARGEYYAPEGAARVLNNYLSPGLKGKVLYDVYRGAGNLLNQAQLGLSAFHLGFVTVDTQVSQASVGLQQAVAGKPVAAAKSLLTFPTAPFTAFRTGSKVTKEYLNPGSQGQGIGKIVSDLLQAGGRVKQDVFYRNSAIASFWDAIHEAKYGKAMLQTFPALLEYTSRPVFEYLVPRMKLGVFARLSEFELSKLGKNASLDDQRRVLQRAWDSVENRLGMMTYDNLFWHKTLKDVLMASVRSVGWNLGTIRELGGGAFVDTPEQLLKAVTGKKAELTPRMAYVLALPMVTALYGAIYHYLATGEGPDDLKDYYFPKTGALRPDGSEDRISLPTYMKDVYAYGKHPLITASHKANPSVGIVLDMLRNEDFYGAEIVNPDDPLVEQMKQVAQYVIESFTPFGVRNIRQQMRVGVPGPQAAQTFVGITPAPASVSRTPEAEAAWDLRRRKKAMRKRLKREQEPGLIDLMYGEEAAP